VQAEPEALALIARAADGSVRDGLSLLDQAIALGGDRIPVKQVQDMLGLGDRQQVMDLLEAALKGECAKALDVMAEMYRSGADPVVLMQDLLDFTHLLTRLKAVPDIRDLRGALAQDVAARASALAASLNMPVLGRTWQLLLKGLSEVSVAPDPQAAAEMAVIRLVYAAGLPDPAELLKKIKKTPADAPSSSQPPPPSADTRTVNVLSSSGGGQAAAAAAPAPQENFASMPVKALATLADVEALLREGKEPRLAAELYQYVRLVKIADGAIDIALAAQARREFVPELRAALSNMTGMRWNVIVSNSAASATLAEQKTAAQNALVDQAKRHPVVAEVLRLFPGAEIAVKQDNQTKKDKP
jgi:DNA polymerase III subunit gamma/tau